MPKFSILKHILGEESHYDLLFEKGNKLAAFRITSPIFSTPQSAIQNFDHRKIYLNYQGPISKNRGIVKMWDKGNYDIKKEIKNLLVIKLSGKKSKATITLKLKSAEQGINALWEISPTNEYLDNFINRPFTTNP